MSEQSLLQVKNISVSIDELPILHGINLDIKAGETHVLMGPNGAGKSTLGYTLMGNPHYAITEGNIVNGTNILLDFANTDLIKIGDIIYERIVKKDWYNSTGIFFIW